MLTLSRRTVLILLSLLVLALGAEFAARLYLTRLAPTAAFDRFASFDQLTARYGIPPLALHRNIGYSGNVEYERGADKHNDLGFRGEEVATPKPSGVFRIVCLGGSATYSTGVDDFRQSYPYLLERYLHEEGFNHVEVINAGLPGYTSWETLLNFELRVLDLAPDLVIFYPDLEDVAARLIWPPEAYRPDNSGYLDNLRGLQPPLWERSSALRMLLIGLGLAQPHTDLAIQWRSRADSSYELELAQQYKQDNYPAGIFLEIPAEEILAANPPTYFENNLRSLVAVADVNDIPIFLTTAAWEDTSDDDPALYYAALAEHNAILQTIADNTNALFFDLAAAMPLDEAYFTNMVGFSEQGNQMRARLLSTLFLDNDIVQ